MKRMHYENIRNYLSVLDLLVFQDIQMHKLLRGFYAPQLAKRDFVSANMSYSCQLFY